MCSLVYIEFRLVFIWAGLVFWAGFELNQRTHRYEYRGNIIQGMAQLAMINWNNLLGDQREQV